VAHMQPLAVIVGLAHVTVTRTRVHTEHRHAAQMELADRLKSSMSSFTRSLVN